MSQTHDSDSSSRTETNETPEGDTSGTPDAENGSQTAKSNKEARYRVERNEARAERDALAERIQRMQRAEVERLAADGLSHPADLFSLSGNELADYLTEDGDVDADKVAADVTAIVAERPGLQRPRHPAGYDPSQGQGGKGSPKREPTWGALLKN